MKPKSQNNFDDGDDDDDDNNDDDDDDDADDDDAYQVPINQSSRAVCAGSSGQACNCVKTFRRTNIFNFIIIIIIIINTFNILIMTGIYFWKALDKVLPWIGHII